MDQGEEEIQQKQQLLQTEIIDKNYDKTSFINFCLSKKENGDDLSNWTISELQGIIKEFQDSQQQEQPHEEKIEEQKPTENPKDKKEGEEINKENVEKLEKFNADEAKNFKEKTIECRKLDKTELNDKTVTVEVKNPTEKSGGIFSKSFILYDVITSPMNWNVQRRFSDFDALRQLLVKYYPSYHVPPLPGKKITNRRFETDFIMKRMKFLNLFINNVLKREEFKASEILVSFLSYTDRGKFEAKFKEFQTQVPSSYVEDYKNLDGKVVISHDEGNEKYFTNINKYFKLQAQIFQRLGQGLKGFYNALTNACEALQDVHKYFEIMHVLNTRVLMKETITKSFEELAFFFDNWKKVIIKQKELVKTHMKDFYKYVKLEGIAYEELIDRRTDLKNKYTAEVARVTAKKEKLYATMDPTKFELGEDRDIDRERLLKDKPYAFEKMCRADNLNLEKLYNQLGYANKMNMKELKRIINGYCKRYIENIKEFNTEFYPSINDLIGIWSNLQNFALTQNMPTAK